MKCGYLNESAGDNFAVIPKIGLPFSFVLYEVLRSLFYEKEFDYIDDCCRRYSVSIWCCTCL